MDTTGEGIARKLIEALKGYGIDFLKMRGQGYDGCASMKGHISGEQARVIKE